jgi:two-component system sensor kinase FixL
MALATLLVSAVSISSLYNAAIEQHRLRLLETVKSQARLIEAIAQFDNLDGEDNNLEKVRQSTIEKVAAAHREFGGFGESGEFMLAQREANMIAFVLSRRQAQAQIPHPIPFKGEWAEPMRRALSGKSGILTALDYRGVKVLAAHEPVSILDLGLVAKIDISEIRKPFIQAGLLVIGVAIFVIFIASRLFFRISKPIEEAIDQQSETFRILAETMREAIIIASTRGIIDYANPAAEKLFGYKPGDLPGSSVKCLMPEEHRIAHDGYMQAYLQTGKAKIIGIGRHLTAIRKDGSRFPIYLSIGDIRTDHARLFAGVIMDMSEQQKLQREILEIPVAEQRRIGQELHDGLGQQLTGLGLLATSLLNKASKPEHALAAQLASGLQEAIAQVRALSRGLVPVDIDTQGFMHSLKKLIEEIRRQTRLSIQLTIKERILITDNTTALHLYRIVQEALNNAVKHAEASQIDISLGVEGGRGCFLISDNGKGMQDRPENSPGLGLRIMRYRCSLIDAELLIESSYHQGTRLKCYFPVADIANSSQ